MKSIQRAHVVVVTDSNYRLLLATRLRRMDVARVTEVPCLKEARRRCQSGEVDVCIVALDDRVPDTIPIAEGDAPGRGSSVRSLMVVPAATPYLRKAARRCGYLAAVSGQIPAPHVVSPHRCRAAAAACRKPQSARDSREPWHRASGAAIARRPQTNPALTPLFSPQ